MESNHKTKVLIADDHPFYLDGLKNFFLDNEVYEIAGEACNGEELVRRSVQLRPQVILTDLKMPVMNGAEAIKKLLCVDPDIKCLVLSSYDNDYSIVEALEAGAMGYINKNMPKNDLFDAMDMICLKIPYYCRTTSLKLARNLGKSNFNPYTHAKQQAFSETAKKIIRLICQEKTNREIAGELFLSIRTVENNRSRILHKMNVKTTAGVAIYAIKHGLYFLED